jgi:hypothetical protein
LRTNVHDEHNAYRHSDIKARRKNTALVNATNQLNYDFTRTVIIYNLKVTNVS